MAACCPRRWLAVGMLGLAVLAPPTAAMPQEPAQRPGGQPVEFRHDFRKAKLDDRLFKLLGPDALALVKEEPEGLRLTVPLDQK